MYTSIENFKNDFKSETAMTLKMFRAIPDDKLKTKPHENIRSLQRLAWHITLTLGEMMGKTGLSINCPDENTPAPDNIEAICRAYETAAASVLAGVEKNWNDNQLTDLLDMYGEKWSKGTVLDVLIKHEIHHRAQMSTIMRLLDIKVPGTYGPSKEEWAAWNMPAMD